MKQQSKFQISNGNCGSSAFEPLHIELNIEETKLIACRSNRRWPYRFSRSCTFG